MPQLDLFDIGPAGMPSGRLELHCAGAECSIHLGGSLFTTFPNDRGTTGRYAAVMLHEGGHASQSEIAGSLLALALLERDSFLPETRRVYYSWFDVRRMDKADPFEKRWAEIKTMAAEVKKLMPAILSVEEIPEVVATGSVARGMPSP